MTSDAPDASVPPPRLRQWITLEMAADLAAIPAAVARLRAHLAGQGVPPAQLDPLQLAVTEALSNAVRHGTAAPAERGVELAWNWGGDWLELTVSEPGCFEPPAEWTRLPGDLQAEGGRGGFLIQASVDEVRHENGGGRHTLRMRKRIGAAAPPASEAETQRTLEAMTEELSNTYESLAALLNLGGALATAATLPQFLNAALGRVRELVAFDTGYVRLADGTGGLAVLREEVVRASGVPARIRSDDETIEARAFREQREATVVARRTLPPADPLWRAHGCAFVCPVVFQGRAAGVLTIARNGGTDYFTAGQLGLMRTVAEFVGIARANAELQDQRRQQERTSRDLEIARQIQESLLPKSFPLRADWQVFGLCRNAQEVGGDFFDVREIPGRGVLLVIADVMGKGLPAALLATLLRTAVRGRPELAEQPGELLTEVNRELAADLQRLEIFITAQVAFLQAGGGKVFYASAGHGPMLALARNQKVAESLAVGGLPLGVVADEHYETATQRVPGGLRLLMMTDGIYEAEGRDGEQVGLARIAELMGRDWNNGPADFCAQLLDRVRPADAACAAPDDCTLLAAEFLR